MTVAISKKLDFMYRKLAECSYKHGECWFKENEYSKLIPINKFCKKCLSIYDDNIVNKPSVEETNPAPVIEFLENVMDLEFKLSKKKKSKFKDLPKLKIVIEEKPKEVVEPKPKKKKIMFVRIGGK